MHKKIFKKIDESIVINSFICSIMIVGIHAFNAHELPIHSITYLVESVLSHGLFTAAVPIFLFTSGYLFYKNIDSISDCFKKQKTRILTVLVPFLAWSSFYCLFYTVTSKLLGINMSNTINLTFVGIIKSILLYEYCFPLWYMWQLILYVIISPLIYQVLLKKKFSIIIFLILIILITCGPNVAGIDIFDGRLNFKLNYFIYYYIGCLAAINKSKFRQFKKIILKIPLILVFMLYIAFGILGGLVYDGYFFFFNKRSIIPFIAFFLWIFLHNVNYKNKNKNISIFSKISTMVVYAIHPFVGVFVERALRLFQLPNIVQYFCWFGITFVCSCFASLVIKKIKIINLIFSGNR